MEAYEHYINFIVDNMDRATICQIQRLFDLFDELQRTEDIDKVYSFDHFLNAVRAVAKEEQDK